MEYVLLAALIVWMLSILIGFPLWNKYMVWIKKNFGNKE